MKKRFNVTGVCVPEQHYMVDISGKVAEIFALIEQGDYFVINRPRQFGKTTTIYMLNRFLKASGKYFPIKMSFEGIGSDSYKSEAAFIEAFLPRLKWMFEMAGQKELTAFVEKDGAGVDSISKLDIWFSKLVMKIGKPVVLMIDEVDKSCNNQLFLDFLGMLRDKYLKRIQGEEPTFHSVILAGMHDVKSLKVKVRPEDDAKYNSPWNIAIDFKVELGFSTGEIAAMLESYAKEKHVEIDFPYYSEKLFYYTSGHPFLVSFLCKIIDEELLPGNMKKAWKKEFLMRAVQLAMQGDNTNFQSLIKNLANNGDLFEFVFKIIMHGKEFSYNPRHEIVHLGTIYGILKEENGKVRVHNRVYEQLIYDYMSSHLDISGNTGLEPVSASYIEKDGTLNIEKVIGKFQEFMIEQYSTKDAKFIERNGRLLFLAYVKPIINGKGFDFKEVQISEEKRLDVVITFENHKYIIELKTWRGDAYHREGIRQLCDYLDRQHRDKGYLLIFDTRKETGYRGKVDTLEREGKQLFVAWM